MYVSYLTRVNANSINYFIVIISADSGRGRRQTNIEFREHKQPLSLMKYFPNR